jgi:hypothetical protein
MNTPKATPAPAGNFVAMLQGKVTGETLASLDAKLSALVERVQETGRPGSLTYKLKVTPNARKGVKLVDRAEVKLPEENEGVSFFWVGQGGALLKNDPNQTELPLRIVDDEQQPLKTAANS